MNVSISEGGLGRKFDPVNKLKVNNTGGGASMWVAVDTVAVGDISVSSNGVYPAVLDELYAYDEVTVDVPVDITDPSQDGSVTGTDPDTGNDYEYGLDDDGNLDVSMLPSAIHIVVKPRKLKYEDGETIDYAGIHVYLMDGNNKRYTDAQYPTGEIPFEELIFPVTIAESSGTPGSSATSDLDTTPLSQPIPFDTSVHQTGWFSGGYDGARHEYEERMTGSGAFICYGNKNFSYLYASEQSSSFYTQRFTDGEPSHISENTTNGQFTYGGKTVHYTRGTDSFTELRDAVLTPVVDAYFYDSNRIGEIAWTLIYGNITSGDVEIPVQWMRSDGEILEDVFEIEVGAGGEPGPPEPDPWDGLYDFEWQGHKYNFNRRIVPEVHFANGYVWQEGISTEFSVEQAVSNGLIIRLGSV